MKRLNFCPIVTMLTVGIVFAGIAPQWTSAQTTPSTRAIATTRPDDPAARMAMLGVSVSVPATGDGLKVEFVAPDSPAASAGLQIGDVLLQLDDQLVFHPLQLQKLVERSGLDREVAVTYLREEKRITRLCRLAALPANPVGLQPGVIASDEMLKQALRAAGIPEGDIANLSYIRIGDPGNAMLVLNKTAAGWVLSIHDLAGNELFSGPLNTEADRAAVPEKYRPMLPLFNDMMR